MSGLLIHAADGSSGGGGWFADEPLGLGQRGCLAPPVRWTTGSMRRWRRPACHNALYVTMLDAAGRRDGEPPADAKVDGLSSRLSQAPR